MKKRVFQVAIIVISASLLLHAADRKKRVAVFDFDYATVHSQSAALFGSDVDVGKGMADLLVKYLVKDGTYSVIERKALDKILAEQNFSTSDRANPASAAKLGKLLGVDAIIIGSITQFGGENKDTKIGGGGGGFGGFGLGGSARKNLKRSSQPTPASLTSIPARFSLSPMARANRSAKALPSSVAAVTGADGAQAAWISAPATSRKPLSVKP
jgi:hypothetical protein